MIGIIFNPAARGEKAIRFREHLADLGPDVRVVPTRHAGDARVLAQTLVADGHDCLVAAGGDGTVNEVLNGLCDHPDGLSRTRLGVIPLGTVNVLARELGVPAGFRGAWAWIRSGAHRLVDLPCAEFASAEGARERRHFILLAGAGLDSRAIGLVNWQLKKRLGPMAYVWAGVRAMRHPHRPLMAGAHTVEMAAIGNGRFYGGRFPLFPGACLDDGLLDFTLVPRVTWPVVLRVFLHLLSDRVAGSRDVVRFRGPMLTLESAAPVPLQLDGDLVGWLPATITVRARALKLAAPAVADRPEAGAA